jgi:DNA repair protein RadD
VGVAAEYMDGETSREEREEVFGRFRSGETRIICNVGVLTTGIDLDVRCIILARPTKSRMLFVQTIGRGLRTAEGKDHLLILDHAGNHLRLGMVTDIGQRHLDDGKERQSASQLARERSEPKPRLCEGCKVVIPRASRECPSCGSPVRARTEVEAVDGELIELGSRRSGAPTIEDKAAVFGELKGHTTLQGYSDGWASHKYRERFGVWPNDPRVRCARLTPPSLKTKNWIVSRRITFAKARERLAHG